MGHSLSLEHEVIPDLSYSPTSGDLLTPIPEKQSTATYKNHISHKVSLHLHNMTKFFPKVLLNYSPIE